MWFRGPLSHPLAETPAPRHGGVCVALVVVAGAAVFFLDASAAVSVVRAHQNCCAVLGLALVCLVARGASGPADHGQPLLPSDRTHTPKFATAPSGGSCAAAAVSAGWADDLLNAFSLQPEPPSAEPPKRPSKPPPAPKVIPPRMELPQRMGSIVAIVTPMKGESSRVDYPSFRKLVRWHVESGTNGLCVLGTTGEANTLSMSERSKLITIAVEEAKQKIPIIVGTGCVDPKEVIRLSQHAKEMGADATLVSTPYYVKPTQAGLVTHFRSIADAVDIPLLLYNVPGRTGVDMLADAVAACATHPNIVGIKDATGDVSRVKPLREKCGAGFRLLSGDDDTSADFVLAGGDGTISVTANVCPSEMAHVIAVAMAGDEEATNAANLPLQGLHTRLFLQSNPIPVKWALARSGRIPSGIRAPMTPLEDEYHPKLEAALKEASIPLKGTKKRADPNRPKRPRQPYMFYNAENHKRVRSENQGMSFPEISKIISQQFNSLTPDERKRYDDMAAQDRLRYEREMESFTPAVPKSAPRPSNTRTTRNRVPLSVPSAAANARPIHAHCTPHLPPNRPGGHTIDRRLAAAAAAQRALAHASLARMRMDYGMM